MSYPGYREPGVGGTITGRDGQGNPIYTFGTTRAAAAGQSAWLNVWSYYQTADGTAHDLMINRAIAAAVANSGGVVYAPAGVYSLTAGIVIPAGNISFCGDGAATILKPVAGATFDVISTTAPPDNTTVMPGLYDIELTDFAIDGSNMAGTVAGQGNGIHLWTVSYSLVRHVHIINVPNWAVMNESNTASDSFDNHFEHIRTNSCAGGLRFESGEGSTVYHCFFYGANNNTAANQNVLRGSGGDNGAYALKQDTGNVALLNCFFGGGGNITHELVQLNGFSTMIGCQFDNIYSMSLSISGGAHYSQLLANDFELQQTGGAGHFGPVIQLGASNCIISNNSCPPWTGSGATYIISESGANAGNVIDGNQFAPGSAGIFSLNAGSTDVLRDNPGFNPRGHAVTQPAVPASTTAQTNFSGCDCTVYVSGGTVSAISVGGSATGLTTGAVRVPAGSTIALTYSAAPTWQWFGD